MSIIVKIFYYNTCRLIRPAQDECIDDVTEGTNASREKDQEARTRTRSH